MTVSSETATRTSRHLGDDEAAVLLNLGDGVTQDEPESSGDQLVQQREAVAADHLPGAFEQMTADDAARQAVPVVRAQPK